MGAFWVRVQAAFLVAAEDENAAAAAVAGALCLRNTPGEEPMPLPVDVSADGASWSTVGVPLQDAEGDDAEYLIAEVARLRAAVAVTR